MTPGVPLLLGRRPQRPGTEFLAGVEHEFRVLRDGQPVDFRDILHTLDIDGLRIDPGDVNAYRCRSGISLTADGPEAEFATPPVTIGRGFAQEAGRWVRAGRAELEAALPAGCALEGYSTHISVSVPDDTADAVVERFVKHFSAAFALLLERSDSQGIYVRPRPGRIELCGEFAEGAGLSAALVFAVGAVLACRHDSLAGVPALRLTTLPGVERFGVRVRRNAYGMDLYAAGREGTLVMSDGLTVSVPSYLDRAWRCARESLGKLAAGRDLRMLDGIVRGSLPLGIERPAGGGAVAGACVLPSSPFAVGLGQPPSGKFAISPALLTWELAVFRFIGPRDGYVGVPRRALAEFERLATRGALDRQFAAFLRLPASGRILEARAQLAEPALFDAVGDPSALVPPERPPLGVVAASGPGRTGKLGQARPSKAMAGPASGGGPPGEPGLPPLSPIGEAPTPVRPSEPPGRAPEPPPAGPPGPPDPPPSPTFWTRFTVVVVALLAMAGAIGAFALVDATRSNPSHAVTATKTAAPTRVPALAPATPGQPTETPLPTRAATRIPTATPTRPNTGGGEAPTATPATAETETPTGTAAPSESATASPSASATATSSTPTKAPSPTATATHPATPTGTAVATIPATPAPLCTPSPGAVCPQQ